MMHPPWLLQSSKKWEQKLTLPTGENVTHFFKYLGTLNKNLNYFAISLSKLLYTEFPWTCNITCYLKVYTLTFLN